jgi:hypothetical protein
MGAPTVDGVNALVLASRCTDAPLRFVMFKQEPDGDAKLELPSPAVLIADASGGGGAKYHRQADMAVRSPTMCAKDYLSSTRASLNALLVEQKDRWAKVAVARPMFDQVAISSVTTRLMGISSLHEWA